MHASCILPLYRDGKTSDDDKTRLLASIFMGTMGCVRRRTGNCAHMVPTYIRELSDPDLPTNQPLRVYSADTELPELSEDRPISNFGFPFTRTHGHDIDRCRVAVIDFGKWTLANFFHFMCKF